MNTLFTRKPIGELLAEEGRPNSLKRELGAGDLIMLAIGAVIGAGIFSSIGTAAAGEILPDGVVVRYGAGPALVVSFILLGLVCGLAALCYAELASLSAFAIVCIGVLVLRIKEPDRPRPFRVPFVWPVTLAWSGPLHLHHVRAARARVGAVRHLAPDRGRGVHRLRVQAFDASARPSGGVILELQQNTLSADSFCSCDHKPLTRP